MHQINKLVVVGLPNTFGRFQWSNRNCFSVEKSKSSCISKKTHQNVLSKRCITSNQHSCSKPSLKSEVLIRKLWRTDGLPGEIWKRDQQIERLENIITNLKEHYADHARDLGKSSIIINDEKHTTFARTQPCKRYAKLRWLNRGFPNHQIIVESTIKTASMFSTCLKRNAI